MRTDVLFLEDVPGAPQLALHLGAKAARADSPLQAARALASESPPVLVVGRRARWAHELLAALPYSKRPPVVAVGDRIPTLFGLVDRWLSESADRSEVTQCFASAVNRAKRRIERGDGRNWDAETQLPSRNALLAAFVRKSEWARHHRRSLSVVVTRVIDILGSNELGKASAVIGPRTRRNEITARVGPHVLMTLLHGGGAAALRLRARFETHLLQGGVSAQLVCREVNLQGSFADLLRAADDVTPPRRSA